MILLSEKQATKILFVSKNALPINLIKLARTTVLVMVNADLESLGRALESLTALLVTLAVNPIVNAMRDLVGHLAALIPPSYECASP